MPVALPESPWSPKPVSAADSPSQALPNTSRSSNMPSNFCNFDCFNFYSHFIRLLKCKGGPTFQRPPPVRPHRSSGRYMAQTTVSSAAQSKCVVNSLNFSIAQSSQTLTLPPPTHPPPPLRLPRNNHLHMPNLFISSPNESTPFSLAIANVLAQASLSTHQFGPIPQIHTLCFIPGTKIIPFFHIKPTL